jgi:hypothetical protein
VKNNFLGDSSLCMRNLNVVPKRAGCVLIDNILKFLIFVCGSYGLCSGT